MSIVKATYTNGVFKPVEPISLPEGTKVEFEVNDYEERPWMRFAGCISSEDAAQMTAAIEDAFEQINPDDWQ